MTYRGALTPARHAANNEREKERSALKSQEKKEKKLPASSFPAGSQKACPHCKVTFSSAQYARGMKTHLKGYGACRDWVEEHGDKKLKRYLPEGGGGGQV